MQDILSNQELDYLEEKIKDTWSNEILIVDPEDLQKMIDEIRYLRSCG